MTANDYPGNPSLPAEVRERVMTTFKQTLTLYDEVQLDEVVAGCDLILEMDSRFEPARKLRQKAKDPASPIDMAELYALRDAPAATPATNGDDTDASMLEAVEALNGGDYERAVDLCNAILAADPSNEEAQRIGEQANERLEAGPFIAQFLQEAENALASGDRDGARRTIDKARSLDPLHPKIAEMTQRVDAAPATPPAPGPEPAAPSEGGSGFDFGGDSSPFASAFGGASSDQGGGFESSFSSSAAEDASSAESPAEPVSAFDSPSDSFSSFDSPVESAPAAPAAPEPGDEIEPESGSDFAFAAEPAAEDQGAPDDVGFGFTLEPDDAPPAPPTPPPAETSPAAAEPAQSFDFAAGEVEVSGDDQQKIAGYLAEGDRLFETGDYQGAIDAWSKIFLIDVTNDQASERIEAAKDKKREADEKLEELLNTGIAAFNRRDDATARGSFEEVIAQDPDNFRAHEYLEKLTARAAARPAGVEADSMAPELDADEDLYQGDYEEDSSDGPAASARPAAAPAKTAPRPAAPAPKKSSSRTAIIAVVAVLLLAVGGWFGWSMLAGGDDAASADAALTQGKIKRAEVLAADGDFAKAIEILSGIQPGDPMREQALQLIAQYRQQQAQTGGMIGGRPVNQVRDEFLTQAREAFAAEDYVAAKSAFEEAAKLKPLDPADREMYETSSRQVSKLDAASTLFAQGSYAEAAEELNRILTAEPDNVNARKMLVNAHFNLGVMALRNSNLSAAADEFRFVLEQTPDDTIARRSLEIAQTYENSPRDLMYDIYVKYLPLR